MASLYNRGKYIWIKWYDKNKKKYESLSTKIPNNKEGWLRAKRFKVDVEARIRLSRYEFNYIVNIPILSDALIQFVANKQETTRSKLALKTIDIYKNAVKKFIDVAGDKLVTNYTPEDFHKLEANMTANKLSINTQSIYSRQLHSLFNFILKKKWIKTNPIDKIKGEYKDVIPLSADQLTAIFDYCKPKPEKFIMVKLMYLCALRISEMNAMYKEDFDLVNNLVYIRNIKGKRMDSIPMLSDIKKFIQDEKLVGAGKITVYEHKDSVKSFWANMIKNVGFHSHTHQLRKTRGTDLANAGVDPLFLQKFMRHRDFRTTQKSYIKIDMVKMTNHIDLKLGNSYNIDTLPKKQRKKKKIKKPVTH